MTVGQRIAALSETLDADQRREFLAIVAILVEYLEGANASTYRALDTLDAVMEGAIELAIMPPGGSA